MFWTKVVDKTKTHILCSVTFSENCTIYEIIPKNMVETEGQQMTSQYGAYALHAGKSRVHAHAHAPGYPHTRTHARGRRQVSNTSCFSKVTVIHERTLPLLFNDQYWTR